MRRGHGLVSLRDQQPDARHDTVIAAGCDEVFVDKASGTLARRPGLDKALLTANRTGELGVTKLDRLGRSLEHRACRKSRPCRSESISVLVEDAADSGVFAYVEAARCCAGR